jgi:hypothetical protein
METKTMKTDATIQEMLRTQEKSVAKNAFLPFEEKIKILIRMQKEAAELYPDSDWTVWVIPELNDPKDGR